MFHLRMFSTSIAIMIGRDVWYPWIILNLLNDLSSINGYAPRGLWWHFKCLFLFVQVSTIPIYVALKSLCVNSYRLFSWEGIGTLPQNSYKPLWDLWEATLLRRAWSVQWLARSFGTDKQTTCYFIIGLGGNWILNYTGHISSHLGFYKSWLVKNLLWY